jgi:hypothetical protein
MGAAVGTPASKADEVGVAAAAATAAKAQKKSMLTDASDSGRNDNEGIWVVQ